MFELSTLTQFGADGTNQLNVAARANGASAGFFGLKTYGHSQPLPMKAAARPFANGMLGYGCASSFVLLARERAKVMLLNAVRPLIACGVVSVPCHLLPFLTAIWPPKSAT